MTGRPKPLILVADDDIEICALVRTQLERAGFDAISAKDGEEALALAQEHRPDVALLDVMMPKLNGYDVTRALREDERTRDMPVIILTARAGGRDESYGYEVGADDYFKKPFDFKRLRARISELLEDQAGR